MKIISAIALLLFACTGLDAQVADGERIDAVRARARTLASRLPELPEPPAPSLAGLPTPDPALLTLADEFIALADQERDLDIAPGLRIIAARIHRSVGDPRSALEQLELVVGHELAVTAQKVEGRERRAQLYSGGGGHAFALKEYENLQSEFPDHRSLSLWTGLATEQKALAEKKGAVAAELGRALRGADRSVRARADQALRRFLVANPLAPEAAEMLEALLGSLGEEATVAMQLPIIERIALYTPDSEAWPKAISSALTELAREGEYEIALLFCQRIRMRSEAFGSPQLEAAKAAEKQLRQVLARIATRDLDVAPKTKRLRLADLRRKARRGADPDLLVELVQDFLADYPGASERAELRLLMAAGLEARAPERALALYRQAAGDDRGGARGFEALMAAASLCTQLEGPEAALALLADQAEAYERADQGIPIALERARLLDGLDRWEEARALLAPWKAKAQGLDAGEIEKLDAALAAKLEG